MFQRQQKGKRLGLASVVTLGAFLGVLYYPSSSGKAEEALALGETAEPISPLLELHEGLGRLQTDTRQRLLHASGVASEAASISDRIGKLYTTGIQKLSACGTAANPDNCAVQSSYAGMDATMDLLKDLTFFASSTATDGVNAKKTAAAFTFVRTNRAALLASGLTQGPCANNAGANDSGGARLNEGLNELEKAAQDLKDVVTDMQACTVRVAFDALDVYTYGTMAAKYIAPMQTGGKLSLATIMDPAKSGDLGLPGNTSAVLQPVIDPAASDPFAGTESAGTEFELDEPLDFASLGLDGQDPFGDLVALMSDRELQEFLGNDPSGASAAG